MSEKVALRVAFVPDMDGPWEREFLPVAGYQIEYSVGMYGELVIEYAKYDFDFSDKVREVADWLTVTVAPGEWKTVEWVARTALSVVK